jgi:hypothetical protein
MIGLTHLKIARKFGPGISYIKLSITFHKTENTKIENNSFWDSSPGMSGFAAPALTGFAMIIRALQKLEIKLILSFDNVPM